MSRLLLLIVATILSVVCMAHTSSASYNTNVALRHLMFSYAAYCPDSSLQSWSCKWCESGFTPHAFLVYSATDTFGYVGYDTSSNSIVITFRGTVMSDLENWITDLNAAKTVDYDYCDQCLVHEGFLEAFRNVKSQVMSAVKDLINSYGARPIFVTGHSLGAALATLCAGELSADGYSNIHLYTYGCPRVGNDVFASWFSGLSSINENWRVVNQRDIVPHLPPLIMGFHHCPTEVWYQTVSTYTVCNGSGEDPNCSDSYTLPISISDHLDYFGYEESC